MAEDRDDNPQADLSGAPASRPQRLADRVAMISDDGRGQPAPAVVSGLDSEPEPIVTDNIHVGRVIRPAGRMIMGSRALAPVPASAGAEINGRTQAHVFSSAEEGRRRRLSGGAVIMMVCVVAAGATALISTAVDKRAATGGAKAVAPHEVQTSSTAPAAGAAPVAQADSGQNPEHPIAQLAAVASVDQLNAINDGDNGTVVEVASHGAGLSVDNISSQGGAPIPVKVKVKQTDSEEYSFLMFRGLPENFSFSAGFRLKDSWAVSLKDLTDLKLMPPAGYQGKFKLEVLLVKGRNRPVESHIMVVSLGRATRAPADTGAVARAKREAAPAERVLTATPPETEQQLREASQGGEAVPEGLAAGPPPVTINPEEEAQMLDRAMKILGDGDVASARLFLEHIARRGSGKGALALARTYDPLYFRSIATLGGIRPDPKKAKEWYRIAAELGQDGARERLSALAGQ